MIKDIRAEIFKLALQSPDLETMHWYMFLDECFENDEFQEGEMGNMKWRAWVLHQKKEPIGCLLQMLDEIVVLYDGRNDENIGVEKAAGETGAIQ